jgi:Skp family chaperone for outer membrane proteins
VATVSPNRILFETAEGKNVGARLQAFQKERQGDIRTLQERLDTTRKQLAQATDTEARRGLQAQEGQERAAVERAVAQFQVDAQNLQRQVQTELQNRVRPIVDELAKGKGLQLVLNGDTAVVWAVAALDLTPAVIQRMQQQK